MVLIVGVTGVLGRHAARQLLKLGCPVRGLTRFPENAGDLKEMGAEIVQGDLIDRSSLDRACMGVEAVLASAHQLMGTGSYSSEAVDWKGHLALIEAAKAAGVGHFVYTSALGAATDHPVDFFRSKAWVEGVVKGSGLSYTILRPPAFMEWHVHNLLGKSIVERGKTTIYGSGNNPTNFMAGKDVAYLAVLALTDARLKDRILEMGGPDNLSKNQVAELYGRFLGRRPKVSHVPTGVMKVMAPVMQLFNPVIGRLMMSAVWGDTTDQTFDARRVVEEFPMEMVCVEDFVRQMVAGR